MPVVSGLRVIATQASRVVRPKAGYRHAAAGPMMALDFGQAVEALRLSRRRNQTD